MGDGATGIYIACQNDHSRVASTLLQLGADCSIKRSDGWTPFIIAYHRGHNDVVFLLLSYFWRLMLTRMLSYLPLWGKLLTGFVVKTTDLIIIQPLYIYALSCFFSNSDIYIIQSGISWISRLHTHTQCANSHSQTHMHINTNSQMSIFLSYSLF